MTTLLLRADAGPDIGVGHLSRCVALAEEAVARGWRVTLIGTLTNAAWLTARLTELGVEIRPTWTMTDWAEADIVLIDHYAPLTALTDNEDMPSSSDSNKASGPPPPGYRERLARDDHDSAAVDTFPCIPRVVSMEDGPYGRRSADIAVDCNLAPAPRPDDGTPLVLRDPVYAPLRAAVRSRRP